MATSGTVGLTRFTTRKVIDNAYGLCKITRPEITSERIEVAKDWLFLRMSAAANKGIPLWAIEKQILPLYVNTTDVPLPIGAYDLLNLNTRKTARQSEGTATASEGVADNAFDGDFETKCIQTVAAGWIQLQFEQGATFIPMFGFLPGASGVWDYEMQGSNDGAVWTTVYTSNDEVITDRAWVWFDVDGMAEWQYMRLKATGTTILNIRELVFANTPNEINCAILARDDYSNLPDKVTTGQPTQFWFDRQRAQPIIHLWPSPGEITRFWNLTAYLHWLLQDVGRMTEELDVRQTDMMAFVKRLGADLAKVDKEVKDENLIARLEQEGTDAWNDMWAGESDRAPTMLTPNIGPYTR